MRLRLIVALVCAVLLYAPLLSACDSLSLNPGGVNELLRAPTLNRKQAEIYSALEATIRLADIAFRYPIQGDNRTPFVFYDLDGDGLDEAIVFYSYVERPQEIRFKLLKQDKTGVWISFSDMPGHGDQVDFIEFANIASRDILSVLIGWQDTARGESRLEIYSIGEGGLNRDSLHLYYRFSIVDYGGSELSRVVIITRESRGQPFELCMIGGANGKVRQISSIALFEDVEYILRMSQGALWDGSLAVFIDELFDNETVATEIIRLAPWGLVTVAGAQLGQESPEWDYYLKTFRPDRVLCMDVDNDDRIEVPHNIIMPGVEESDSNPSQMMLTVYRRPGPEGLTEAYTTAMNEADGYMVFYPERWLGNVAALSYPESNQWRFFKIDERSRELTVELLRITQYQSRDYAEGAFAENILLDTRGAMRYYAYIPPASEGDPLALTEEELAEGMFLLI